MAKDAKSIGMSTWNGDEVVQKGRRRNICVGARDVYALKIRRAMGDIYSPRRGKREKRKMKGENISIRVNSAVVLNMLSSINPKRDPGLGRKHLANPCTLCPRTNSRRHGTQTPQTTRRWRKAMSRCIIVRLRIWQPQVVKMKFACYGKKTILKKDTLYAWHTHA